MVKYGFNGTNTAKVLNSQVRGLLLDMFEESELDTLIYRLRNDKYEGAMPDDEIQNVIALHELFLSQGKSLDVIYTFDTRNEVSMDENFYGFLQLLASGVHIAAAEMGNEEWASVAGHNADWEIFQSKFESIISELQNIGYEGKIIFPITQNNPRFTSWDNKGIDYINSSTQYEPAIHLYYNHIDAPIIGELDREDLPPSDYNINFYIEDKDVFYETLCNQIFTSDLLNRNIDFVRERMPGKKIWFTEYGPAVNAGGLQNTLGYHMADFKVLADSWVNQDDIAAMCKHNGPTIPLTGIISKKVKFDTKEEEFIPRLSYHTMKLFLSGIGKLNNYPFYNLTRTTVELENSNKITFINGNNWYSSSGRVGWWGEGTVGFHEIDQINNEDNPQSFPPLSYGFFQVEEVIPEVEGCMDENATNYNPLATIDDGSCIYEIPKVYGCMDPKAKNFNPLANVSDGSCIYEPKPTGSKWWNKLKRLFGWTS